MNRRLIGVAVCATALCACNDGTEPREQDPSLGVAAQALDSLAAPSEPTAIRFLEEATFGPTLTAGAGVDVAHVQAVGIPGFITEQRALPASHYDFASTIQAQFYGKALASKDQLRQRVAFALSQILVTSGVALKDPTAMPPYLNLLVDGAFGNYETLLYNVSQSPAMGDYLDMVGNDIYDTAGNVVAPNENYAREILQLFGIGLVLLNDNGTLAGGVAQASYTQDQVEGFAHVFTGWQYDSATTPGHCPSKGRRNPVYYYNTTAGAPAPMIPCDNNHDLTPQTLLNGFVSAGVKGTYATATERDLHDAVHNIFMHQNLPPFISKQLIQHLVTSNPSNGYVGRISAVFRDSGAGHVRGDLGAVVTAILEDEEARAFVTPLTAQFGHLREPALLVTSALRWFNGATTNGDKINNYTIPMGQDVFRSPTVFNYYPPNYPLPANATLLGPEFAIQNTASSFSRTNFLNQALFLNVPATTIALPAIGTDPQAITDWLNRYLMHGTMSAAMSGTVRTAITAAPTAKRVATGAYVVLSSSQFQIER